MSTLECGKYGYGIEQEGWIVDQDGRPVALINGVSAFAVVRDTIRELTGEDPKWLSAELLSCQAEVKTLNVAKNINEAICEIIYSLELLRQAIKSIDPNLDFVTVAYKDMRGIPLVAADPDAPSFRRVHDWSQTPDGMELLRKSAICSLQLCVSAGLENMTPEDKLRLLVASYNYTTNNYEEINIINEQSTRLQLVEELIIPVKEPNFRQAGLLNDRELTYITRPTFRSVDDLFAWKMAHSGVSEIADIQSKDAHGLLLKGKMIYMLDQIQHTSNISSNLYTHDLVCLEHRWADAKPDVKKVANDAYNLHWRMIDYVSTQLNL